MIPVTQGLFIAEDVEHRSRTRRSAGQGLEVAKEWVKLWTIESRKRQKETQCIDFRQITTIVQEYSKLEQNLRMGHQIKAVDP